MWFSPMGLGIMLVLSVPAASPAILLWAKSDPRHPLWKHLIDTSAVSLALPCLINGIDSTSTALLVGLHDIGKADPVFQHRVLDFSEELVNAGFQVTANSRVDTNACRHISSGKHFVTICPNTMSIRSAKPSMLIMGIGTIPPATYVCCVLECPAAAVSTYANTARY